MDYPLWLWIVFAFIVFTLVLLTIDYIKKHRAPFTLNHFERVIPALWHFECADKLGVDCEQPKPIDSFFGTAKGAVDWIENAGLKGRKYFFASKEIDTENHVIKFAVDWLNYREAFPCKWCAMKQGTHDGIQGGVFYTAPMIRSEALKFVAAAGDFNIREVWDKDRIVFYTTKA
jgi:hypothetical protein